MQKENVANTFIIHKLLTSVQISGVQPDSRLPITAPILRLLIDRLPMCVFIAGYDINRYTSHSFKLAAQNNW